MCELKVKVKCPHCLSAKVVKNGKKPSGVQNFLCRSCGKQFQWEYLYQGAAPEVQAQMTRNLLHGSGIRDTAKVCSTSPCTVIRHLLKTGKLLKNKWKPRRASYFRVQIDEMWSFVSNKKKKVWIFYVYAPQTAEILAVTMGKRSLKQLDSLMAQLRALQIEISHFCTDKFQGFRKRFKCYSHIIW